MSARRTLGERSSRASRRPRGALAVALAAVLLGACAGIGASRNDAPATPYTDEVFALSERADRAYREGRWIEAARHYRELAERVPSDAYAWFRLGNTYAQQGDYARAVDAYERSLERDAGQAKPWFNLSTAYLLNAQIAMTRSWERLREGDPARAMIETRLETLRTIIHGRIEDVPLRVGAR